MNERLIGLYQVLLPVRSILLITKFMRILSSICFSPKLASDWLKQPHLNWTNLQFVIRRSHVQFLTSHKPTYTFWMVWALNKIYLNKRLIGLSSTATSDESGPDLSNWSLIIRCSLVSHWGTPFFCVCWWWWGVLPTLLGIQSAYS